MDAASADQLITAIAVHLLALTLIAALGVVATDLMQQFDTGRSSGGSTRGTLIEFLRGALTGTSTPLPITGVAAITAVTIIVGEVFYWGTTLIVLGAWMGLNAKPGRLFGRAAVFSPTPGNLASFLINWLIGSATFVMEKPFLH